MFLSQHVADKYVRTHGLKQPFLSESFAEYKYLNSLCLINMYVTNTCMYEFYKCPTSYMYFKSIIKIVYTKNGQNFILIKINKIILKLNIYFLK